MEIKIIYNDKDVLVVDKPAGVVTCDEIASSPRLGGTPRNDERLTLIDYLIEKYPDLKKAGEAQRYGIAHRLDKDTSGILLVAKSNEALIFLQKQFINRKVEKKYTALVCGNVKDDSGKIQTLIGRAPGDKRKQKAYWETESHPKSTREAITEYKVIERYKDGKGNKFTLLEMQIKTGRKHQIRCHLSYIRHPVAGDKMYGFKDSPIPNGLTRQFLHAQYLKIKLPSGEVKEFKSELPKELTDVLKILN